MVIVGKHVQSGRVLRTVVDGYPKRPLGHLCETNLRESHKISSNQASDANGTRPETHARVDFMSSHQYGQLRKPGDFNIFGIQYREYSFKYKAGRSQAEDPKSQTP